jgi:hypothetical protein
MKYKCAYYEDTEDKAFPNHTYLSSFMEKGGRVVVGGKKSITKNTPFPDKIGVIEHAYEIFTPFLNRNMRVSKWYEKELYIFEYGANIKFLKDEYPTQFRTFFEIDEELIDKLNHYVYSFRWLNKYATLIDRDIEMLDFIKDKKIGDEKLIEAIPSYMMGTEEFLKQINISIMDVVENACAIFRSGWK